MHAERFHTHQHLVTNNVVDIADQKIDKVADKVSDHAQQIRQQSEERLDIAQGTEGGSASGPGSSSTATGSGPA